jgi:hypothetical protein
MLNETNERGEEQRKKKKKEDLRRDTPMRQISAPGRQPKAAAGAFARTKSLPAIRREQRGEKQRKKGRN